LSEPESNPDLKREEWIAECDFRNREIAIKEAQQRTAEQDLAIRKEEASRSRWRSPLVVAIFTAAAAALGNAIVAFVSGNEGQELESRRAESTRILEMIKTGTGNPDKAAENLRFLADVGLIEDPHRLAAIQHFLSTRQPGSGPSLPSPTALARDAADAASIYKAITDDAAAHAEERKKIADDLQKKIFETIQDAPASHPTPGIKRAPDPNDKYIRQ
jgi:hypothetical protein